jgi:hypothetical protein
MSKSFCAWRSLWLLPLRAARHLALARSVLDTIEGLLHPYLDEADTKATE